MVAHAHHGCLWNPQHTRHRGTMATSPEGHALVIANTYTTPEYAAKLEELELFAMCSTAATAGLVERCLHSANKFPSFSRSNVSVLRDRTRAQMLSDALAAVNRVVQGARREGGARTVFFLLFFSGHGAASDTGHDSRAQLLYGEDGEPIALGDLMHFLWQVTGVRVYFVAVLDCCRSLPPGTCGDVRSGRRGVGIAVPCHVDVLCVQLCRALRDCTVTCCRTGSPAAARAQRAAHQAPYARDDISELYVHATGAGKCAQSQRRSGHANRVPAAALTSRVVYTNRAFMQDALRGRL